LEYFTKGYHFLHGILFQNVNLFLFITEKNKRDIGGDDK